MPDGSMTGTKRVRLAQRRKAMGSSQEELAERLGVDRSTIVRWERGTTAPQPWARPKLAELLGVSVDQLEELLELVPPWPGYVVESGSRDDPPEDLERSPERDDMKRRELLRLMTVAAALIELDRDDAGLDWDRLNYFASGMRRVDPATVKEYSTLNNYLWRVFAFVKNKRLAYPAVREQLGVLVRALERPHGEAVHRELCAVTADLLQLAGEILFDGNHYTAAVQCYALAADASKQARAYDLWACALTRHAFVELYDRQFAAARPILDLAASLARRGDPGLSTRYWVSTVQAQAFAGLGELEACQRALDHAEQVHHLSGRSIQAAGSALTARVCRGAGNVLRDATAS